MRIPRIYVPQALATEQVIALDAQASRHLVQVLRLRPPAPLMVFNGDGREYRAVLEQTERHAARIRIMERSAPEPDPSLQITLAQGLARGERMDFGLQKAVELGVTKIVPLVTERSMVHLNGERRYKRARHWEGVIVAACEQCGRNRPPALEPIQGLHRWLARDATEHRLVLNPRARSTLTELTPAPHAVSVLVGPEGGLSTTEMDAAIAAGYQPVRMGPRILRTETAGPAVLAALQALWGDFRI